MDAMRVAYDEVYVYTMGRPQFILQHVVDAFAAQTATERSKPIGTRDRGKSAQRPEGPDRDRAIDQWCQPVWAAFSQNRPMIIALLQGVRDRLITTNADLVVGKGMREGTGHTICHRYQFTERLVRRDKPVARNAHSATRRSRIVRLTEATSNESSF
jgi:hypothetical protein